MHGIDLLFNIEDLLRTYGYLGVFAVVFLESGIFFALPGDSLLFTAGLFASISNMHLAILIPTIFVGTFLGGIAGYFIGIYIEHLHRYPLFKKILKPEYIIEAHKFFERHGKAAILMSRFVPLMRTFAPIVAGIARMDRGRFIRYNFFSSLLWSVSITYLGFLLGKAFPQIRDYLSLFIIGVVVVSLIPVAFGWWQKRRSDRRTTV